MRAALLLSSVLLATTLMAQRRTEGAPAGATVVVLEVEGVTEFMPAGSTNWYRCHTNHALFAGDQLRTGAKSRAVVRLSDQSVFRLWELTHLELPPAVQSQNGPGLIRGVLYFFHRGKPKDMRLRTPTVSAVVRGTEFNVWVKDDGTSTMTVLDGEVQMANEFGELTLSTGEQGTGGLGRAPARTALVEVNSAIQWALYYPGVLDFNELELNSEDQGLLADAMSAYRTGDLLAALASYPGGRQPTSDSERVFLAALLLSVGQVQEAEGWLRSSRLRATADGGSRADRLAAALLNLIAVVRGERLETVQEPSLATEWLVDSYRLQSQRDLEGALAAGRAAVELAPDFAFGWSRVAELEFSFGHSEAAQTALERSLGLAQRNAQAHALRGFVLCARNQIQEAIACFEQAMAIDGALGNAWLGRGLCRIQKGQIQAGLEDLQVAALLEPQRALPRSYLGKAYDRAHDPDRAARELELAQRLDPNDPTGWLYSALVLRKQNRINEAVSDLEQSMELNDNRAVYRSRLLLDQDRAVRGANLAAIYDEAGLREVGFGEASRAATTDYGNYSAHLFLANSYDRLRDPNQINLRYETPWLNEYLLANLLAPVGAGVLSPTVSQQEYSRLFEGDRLGVVSDTEYYSQGDWVQTGSQYGSLGNFGYALEASYRNENGQRSNNDQEQLTLSARFKYQVTPQDSVYLEVGYYDAEAGDLAQYYDPADANTGLRVHEHQEPLLLVGYRHEWAPGIHSLVLAGRLEDTYQVSNPSQMTLVVERIGGAIDFAVPMTVRQDYCSEVEIYTVEAQQIFESARHTLIVGGRYQYGEIETESRQSVEERVPVSPWITLRPDFFHTPPQDVSTPMERASVYAYDSLRVTESLLLQAGVSYDWLRYPENFRCAPITDGEQETDAVLPKAGVIWTPGEGTSLQAAYTRSLGGVGFDQSFRLEPAQLAGFSQAFRSLMPESITGANAAEEFETWGLAIQQKLPSRTYLGMTAEWLKSEVDRSFGIFEFGFPPVSAEPSSTPERLEFEEKSLRLYLSQLVGDEWSLGLRYRLSEAELEAQFPEIPDSVLPSQTLTALLHQIQMVALFNHPSGFFAEAQALWTAQSNLGYQPELPGDDFWQFNVFAGYRFWNRRAEVRAGLLNLTDQDYRLNPLNLVPELPRDRTLVVQLRFSF
jgi:tetratricopeptide (TPR) repeat protein